jgi:adenosylhomocysteine nucleosidase
MKLGVVTGLAREVSCLPHNQPDLMIVCAGASPARAEVLSGQLIDQGCRALLSFGIAGALSPDLQVGDIIVSTAAIDVTGMTLPSAENWRLRVCDGLPKADGRVRQGLVYGSETEVSSAQEKSGIFRETGALCVDMETHRMARVAAARAVPFLAIRVISDDADRSIPSAARGVIGADGKPQLLRVIGRLLRDPRQVRPLIALSGNMETAIAQLRRVPGLVGPLFRFA